MPTGAFIQDETVSSSSSSSSSSNLMRVNLLSAQPLGAASLQTSSLQVFLDRRLDQDDNRGMEQAMNDNIVTSNKFLILFESLNNAPGKDTTNSNLNKCYMPKCEHAKFNISAVLLWSLEPFGEINHFK